MKNNAPSLKGQWIGRYESYFNGKIMVNVDEVGDHYECNAYLNPDTRNVPSTIAYVNTTDKSNKQSATAYLNVFDPKTYAQRKWDEVKHLYPNITHDNTAQVEIELADSGTLSIKATTTLSTTVAQLQRPVASEESKIKAKELSWDGYKGHVGKLLSGDFVFRGQSKPWPLQTAFHRRGRYNINRFVQEDLDQLHKRLSGITPHYFDRTIAEQNGAFINLLQHHGYPTPLLDWSYSPYIAAFFAFQSRPINYNGDEFVRIYQFNQRLWKRTFQQVNVIDPPFAHLSIANFLSIGNPRVTPQQSVTTVTNIADIESYVLVREKETGSQFLTAIDMPAKQRQEAMNELRYMGVSASSLFPGIEGVCRELREWNFEL